MARLLAVSVASFLIVAACNEDSTSPSSPEGGLSASAATSTTLQFRQITAWAFPGTGGHTCGVTTEDLAYCWGANDWGELGNGAESATSCGNPCETRPVPVAGGLRFKHLSAGGRFTCGITTTNQAYCWGRNSEGQLGDGTGNISHKPVRVAGGRQFKQIRAGEAHTCAITPANEAYCWGWNGDGQLGDGTRNQRFTPVKVAGGLSWFQLSGGYAHTCGTTTTNRAYCWGSNLDGMVGDGTTIRRLKPTAVTGGFAFQRVDAGRNHTCGVTTTGRAYCWGGNGSGQLGNGNRYEFHKPTLVSGQHSFDHLSAGDFHTCGMTIHGGGLCWGNNAAGQLGTGNIGSTRLTPTRVAGNLVLTQIVATFGYSCAVTGGRTAYCWGDNGSGQIGDGTSGNLRPSPTRVVSPG
ncbi:MAG TPA: hypothetical protein VD930_11585 [Gemmatimonadales bacterium]|nr:hypothetical protein [Gemmatimonadales bacterium]